MDIAEAVDRARGLEQAGKWQEALDLLKEAAREQPCEDLDLEISTLCANRGWIVSADRWLAQHQVRDFFLLEDAVSDEVALEMFSEAQTWADLPDARAGLGGVYLRRGDLEKAEGHLKAALELDPECPPALVLLGRLRLATKDLTGAGEAFATAVQAAPKYAAGYVGLGEALWRSGRRDEAAKAFAAGCAMAEGSDLIYGRFAAMAVESGAYPTALMAWRLALKHSSGNAEAWRGVALESARAGDALEASRALDEAMRLDPEGTEPWVESQKKVFPLLGGPV